MPNYGLDAPIAVGTIFVVGWIMMENSINPPADRLTTYLHMAEASTRRPKASSASNGFIQGEFAEEVPENLRQAHPKMEKTSAQAISPLEEITESLKAAVSAIPALDKTLKFNLKGTAPFTSTAARSPMKTSRRI